MRHIFGLVALLALLAAAPVDRIGMSMSARAQQSPSSAAQHDHAQKPEKSNMQDMMKMHQQMMAEMKAADAKLDQLVQQMNSANGQAKAGATAAVVTELVRQHKSMHQHMEHMHQQMMSGATMKR